MLRHAPAHLRKFHAWHRWMQRNLSFVSGQIADYNSFHNFHDNQLYHVNDGQYIFAVNICNGNNNDDKHIEHKNYDNYETTNIAQQFDFDYFFSASL
jgi:hypothetical protein